MLPSVGEVVYIFTNTRFYLGTVTHIDREIVKLKEVRTAHGDYYENVTISIQFIEAVGYD